EGIYLQKLARIYQQAAEPENAVRIKEQLVQRHIKDQKLDLVADLKIALGDDYEKLKQSEKASQNYQSAYSIAWSLQQFGAAGLALKKLANLYQTYQQPNYALQIYQKLLRVEQQSYNYYGLMKTYEQIAQLYRTAKQYDPALVAYQQALALARSLQYTEQETYFLNQIQAVYGEKNPQPGREN
ncbi:MAG: tetratricopeptide repeat protein, partial [Microcystaceae cyanobacterium]